MGRGARLYLSQSIVGAVRATSPSQLLLDCDTPLFPLNGVCVDVLHARRNPLAPGTFVSPWLAFQESDQYNRISADLPINLAPVVGTHNSFSNYVDGGNDLLNVDQRYSITDQLRLDARVGLTRL